MYTLSKIIKKYPSSMRWEGMETINIVLGISNLTCGLLVILLSIPLKKGSIKMNKFYGFRISKSFESEENWYKINKYGAERFLFWSIPMLAIGTIAFFIPFNEYSVVFWIFLLAPLIIFIPVIETLQYAKNL